MTKSLNLQAIAIIAHNFNPSIFSSHWLAKNNFISEEDIIDNSFFTPSSVRVDTNSFELVVLQDQLHFNQRKVDQNFEDSIEKVLCPIVEKIKETPYSAVGFNFHWFVDGEDIEIKELSSKLFYVPESNLYSHFNQKESAFGSYLSKSFENGRLRLEVKPVVGVNSDSNSEKQFLHFKFNFHNDLDKSNPYQELKHLLKDWAKYRTEAETIMNLL